MGILDVLFPKKCIGCRKVEDYVCPNCFVKISLDVKLLCLVCGENSLNGLTHPGCISKFAIDGAFCGIVYQGIVKKLLYQFKYPPYISQLGETLSELLYESLIQQQSFMHAIQHAAIFVPIPLSSKKRRSRGYNQSRIIADSLSKKLDIPVIDCLIRQKETIPQYGLKREERRENMKGAFGLEKNYEAKSKSYGVVFLVDDILTSGATLLEAAKVLKRNGCKRVYGICLARDQ